MDDDDDNSQQSHLSMNKKSSTTAIATADHTIQMVLNLDGIFMWGFHADPETLKRPALERCMRRQRRLGREQ